MGRDTSAPRPSRSLASIAKGLRESYPDIVKYLGEQETPAAEYNIGAQEAIAPREADIYSKYAPQYAESGAGMDLSAIQGAGGQGVLAAENINRQIDPEYYASREASSNKLGQLLSGIDPNRLTGAERENTARGLARSGYSSGETNVPSNQGAINAALTYGGALDQKRNTVANAINSAAGILPSFNQGKNVFGQATEGARSGANVFAGGQGFGGTQGAEQGQNILNQTTGIQNLRTQLQSQKRDTWDRINEGVSTSICCFIFMEAYNGKLPWYVRFCRDWWYQECPAVANGYKKMAAWLVPLMRKNVFVKHFVNTFMVRPISRIGRFLVGETDSYQEVDLFLHNMWFRIWRLYADRL